MALRCPTEGHRQEWSLRLHSIQHGVVPHGRSQLVQSFVMLIPFLREKSEKSEREKSERKRESEKVRKREREKERRRKRKREKERKSVKEK